MAHETFGNALESPGFREVRLSQGMWHMERWEKPQTVVWFHNTMWLRITYSIQLSIEVKTEEKTSALQLI